MKEYAGSFIASEPILVRLQANAWRPMQVAACAGRAADAARGMLFQAKRPRRIPLTRDPCTTPLLPDCAIIKISG
jgi:hypothetical protein